MMAERTAAVIWKVIAQIGNPIFLWNVFPFHPYRPDQPLTNRPHTSKEWKAGEELLFELISMLRPRRLIAIGNDAADTAARLLGGRHLTHVRHPRYGGQRAFLTQIEKLYARSAMGKV
jgi:uracil-DNA glycosylase